MPNSVSVKLLLGKRGSKKILSSDMMQMLSFVEKHTSKCLGVSESEYSVLDPIFQSNETDFKKRV